MDERHTTGDDLLSAGLPAGLFWSAGGQGSRRAALRRLAGGALAIALLVGAWLHLSADDARALPFAHAGATLAAAAQAVRALGPPAGLSAAPPAFPIRVVERLALGEASFYARGFEGRRTASGETYRGVAFTAAHRTLPFGTLLRVTNVRNGRSVIVRVNDRGPFHASRVVDLSQAAAREIGMFRRGRAKVKVELVKLLDAVTGGDASATARAAAAR